MYRVTVRGFDSGLNELLEGRVYNYRTKKYHNFVKSKNDELCRKAIKQCKDLRGVKINNPIFMEYKFYCKNKRHDRSNVFSGFIKSFEDALQQVGIIKNDGWDDVLTPKLYLDIDKENPRIEVIIHEVERN